MKVVALILLLTAAVWIALEFRRLRKEIADRDKEIEALRKRGSEFVANVSHELKTPLTSIKGFTETLKAGAIRDPHKSEEFLARIDENSDRLIHIVNDILDLAKIESPNMYLEIEKFDPADVMRDIEKDWMYSISERRQELSIKNSAMEIRADRKLLQTALRNLVENAHRYCPEGAHIEIQTAAVTEQGRNFVKVTVSDNGPGISPIDLPRVFERFYRADKSRNRAHGGTGLGLAIVKHIMISHNGFVRAQSEPLKGAKFSLYFPNEAPLPN